MPKKTRARPIPPDGRLTAAQAAARLGIKPATLYAYVSRGLLQRERAPDGRTSLFDAGEVMRLTGRGRRGGRGPVSDLVIESALTSIDGERVLYRGLDAAELARTRPFEDVAGWLWTGVFPEPGMWQAPPAALQAGSRAQAPLPAGILLLDRLRVIDAVVGAVDDLRYDTRREAVVITARALLAALVDCLPRLRPGTAFLENGEPVRFPRPVPRRAGAGTPGVAHGPACRGMSNARDIEGSRVVGVDSLAARLWVRLCPAAPAPGMIDVLNAAMVLLADHELSASTLAARIAASVRADPYAVVGAGLGVVSGALHGAASLAAETMLDEIAGPDQAGRVIGERLRRGDLLPGFGHLIYAAGDPRAPVLMGLLRAALPHSPSLAVAEAVLDTVTARALPRPNIDFALAAFTRAAGMVRGAGEAIFAIARTAGWIGHAIEEYEHRTVFRPRAVYTGLRPNT